MRRIGRIGLWVWLSSIALSSIVSCRADRDRDRVTPDRTSPTSSAIAKTGAESSPQTITTQSFLRATNEGRFDDAYALTSKAYRSGVTRAEFALAAARNPYLRGVTGLYVRRSSSTNRTGTLEGDTEGSVIVMAIVYLTYEDGKWLVSGINLGGVPGLPAFPSNANTNSITIVDAGRG